MHWRNAIYQEERLFFEKGERLEMFFEGRHFLSLWESGNALIASGISPAENRKRTSVERFDGAKPPEEGAIFPEDGNEAHSLTVTGLLKDGPISTETLNQKEMGQPFSGEAITSETSAPLENSPYLHSKNFI